METIVIKRGKNVLGLPSSTTVEAARQQCGDAFGLIAEGVKLVCRGKVILSARSEGGQDLAGLLAGAGIKKLSKAVLSVTGPPRALVEGEGEGEGGAEGVGGAAKSAVKVEDDIDSSQYRRKKLASSMAERRRLKMRRERATARAEASPYRFHRLEPLPNLSDAEKEEDLRHLRDLATDKGVLAVMRKHKWSVGVLKSMPIAGTVGEDPLCILGLNVNKGAEIHVRIRTDNLKGVSFWVCVCAPPERGEL